MYDGEFNLMDNSYTEAGSAEMDNFIVNMGSNTGMNIKGNLDLTIGQGDGTYQGFRTSGANDFLRVAGTVTVAEHMYTLELTGDITYAFNNLIDLGANNSGVQPTYRFNSGTKEAEFTKLTVTPKTGDCGATWNIDGGNESYTYRVIAEDLSASEASDFDFNDVVFDVEPNEGGTTAKIILRAAGGKYALTVGIENKEVHAAFAAAYPDAGYGIGENGLYPLINTNPWNPEKTAILYDAYRGDFSSDAAIRATIQSIPIKVCKPQWEENGELKWVELYANSGQPACKILVDKTFKVVTERKGIEDENKKFTNYVTGEFQDEFWWK